MENVPTEAIIKEHMNAYTFHRNRLEELLKEHIELEKMQDPSLMNKLHESFVYMEEYVKLLDEYVDYIDSLVKSWYEEQLNRKQA